MQVGSILELFAGAKPIFFDTSCHYSSVSGRLLYNNIVLPLFSSLQQPDFVLYKWNDLTTITSMCHDTEFPEWTVSGQVKSEVRGYQLAINNCLGEKINVKWSSENWMTECVFVLSAGWSQEEGGTPLPHPHLWPSVMKPTRLSFTWVTPRKYGKHFCGGVGERRVGVMKQ